MSEKVRIIAEWDDRIGRNMFCLEKWEEASRFLFFKIPAGWSRTHTTMLYSIADGWSNHYQVKITYPTKEQQ